MYNFGLNSHRLGFLRPERPLQWETMASFFWLLKEAKPVEGTNIRKNQTGKERRSMFNRKPGDPLPDLGSSLLCKVSSRTRSQTNCSSGSTSLFWFVNAQGVKVLKLIQRRTRLFHHCPRMPIATFWAGRF